MLVSGFCGEDEEEPIERIKNRSFLGFANSGKAKAKRLDFDPNPIWVLEDMYEELVVAKLKLCEAIFPTESI